MSHPTAAVTTIPDTLPTENVETVRVGDSRYERPFTTKHGLMVTVHEPDGDRYTTYGVSPAVIEAWAAHDREAPTGRA